MVSSSLNILIVEDSENDALLLVREITRAGYDVHYQRVETAHALERFLEAGDWDVVITDHNLPGFSSLDTLRIVKGMGKEVPVIIVSGAIGESTAVEVIKAGANDYVMKDNLFRLVPAIERELRDSKTRREKLSTEKALNHLAQFDSLTNLINRPALMELLKIALMRMREGQSELAVLFVDLDRFKVINDTYGLIVGDKVLSEVAKRLQNCVRRDDILSRYGSDEFVVIVESIRDEAEASMLAEMIVSKLSLPIFIDDFDIRVRGSVGVAFGGVADDSVEDLLQNANSAMYQAKSRGRNNFQIYSPEMNREAEHRRYLELSLHRAMELNEFEIYFQPQMDLKRGRLRGAEALLRWHHGTLGLVPPDEFIELLEETGLIISVGEWVMRTACELWCQWLKDGKVPLNAILSINISSYQFGPQLVETVRKILSEVGIPPYLLDLEITEGTLMDNTEESQKSLTALKNIGIKLSIDDFGTGYSSLSYLTRFPIHALKIDRSFVMDMANNKGNALIAKTIIGLAVSLNLSVIAEGVETLEAAQVLLSQGCEIHQGFYFSKPVTAVEFLKEVVRLQDENQQLFI